MVYLNSVPAAGDSPATQSQADLLENFAQLETQYGTAGDHVEWTALVDNGMHKQVIFNNVIADPVIATPRGALYLKADAGLSSQLFFRNFDVPTAANVTRQMTNLTVTTAGTNYGYQTPWGQIINWGQFTCNVADTVLTYAVPFTAPAQSINLTCISDNGARNAVVRLSANATATCRATNNGLVTYYYAIGV